jgi:membrane associated rhomboid family serine protease
MELTITNILVIITVLVSFGGLSNRKIIDELVFYPVAVSKQGQWYRFFTCGLIHADFFHLLWNMLALFSFGQMVERDFVDLFGSASKWLYLILYVSALLISILPTYYKNKDNYHYRSLGASGAVSAVIFAGVLLKPAGSVLVYFIPMPTFVFAPLYILFTAMMDRRGGDNTNHSAHLWGSLYGLAFLILACRSIDYPIVQNAIAQVRNYF